MPEVANIVFSYKEVATALLKEQGIHEGLWSLFVRFGLNAANLGPSDDDLKPCAIIPILEIGLQKADKENSVTVDAAKVNPRPSAITAKGPAVKQ
jgi:hypothetical protein